MSNTKIWGIRGGIIGDTIISLCVLDKLKKKYPDSYVNWVIHRKCSQAAPLYISRDGIDRIHITEGWESLGEKDKLLKASCDIQINEMPPVRDHMWFNRMDAVDQVFRMAGIDDKLSDDEKYPKLTKWWVDLSTLHSPNNHGYSQNEHKIENKRKSVALFPFAHYGAEEKRSPTKEWWEAVINGLKDDYDINHFGWIAEPKLNDVTRYTNTSLFDQIRLALECDIAIGADAGTMWIMGAYSHPAVHIMTYHFNGHNENPMAFEPKNKNGKTFFDPNHCNKIKPSQVVDYVRGRI